METSGFPIETLLEKNVESTFLPIINLILQFIENDLKSFIIEYDLYPGSAKGLEIQHHNIRKLVDDELFTKKFTKHADFKKIYDLYKQEALYFYSLLGKQTFLSSRYPVKSDCQENSIKNKEIDVQSIIYHWKTYFDCLSKINFVLGVNYLYESIVIEKKFLNLSSKNVVFNYVKVNFKTKDITNSDISYNSILDMMIDEEEKKIIKYIIELLEDSY